MKFETGSLPPDLKRSVDIMRSRTVTNPRDFYGMDYGNRMTSFTVSGNLTNEAIGDILNRTTTAIQGGKSYQDFKKTIDPEVLKNITAPKQVFRSAMNNTYQGARFEQQNRTKGLRPFLRYKTFGDDRVRPNHAAMEGTVAPFDSDFWANNYPPNGFGCRCAAESLTASQVRSEGLEVFQTQEQATEAAIKNQIEKGVPASEVSAPIADKGWSGRPIPGSSPWAPVAKDLSKFEKEKTVSLLTGGVPIPTVPKTAPEAIKIIAKRIEAEAIKASPDVAPLFTNTREAELYLEKRINLPADTVSFGRLAPEQIQDVSQTYMDLRKDYKSIEKITEIGTGTGKYYGVCEVAPTGRIVVKINDYHFGPEQLPHTIKQRTWEAERGARSGITAADNVNHENGHALTYIGIRGRIDSLAPNAEALKKYFTRKEWTEITNKLNSVNVVRTRIGAPALTLEDYFRFNDKNFLANAVYDKLTIRKSVFKNAISKNSLKNTAEAIADGFTIFRQGYKVPEEYFKLFEKYLPEEVIADYAAKLKAGKLKDFTSKLIDPEV